MHQQNPVDAPPESRGTTRIWRTPTESCLHLQREPVNIECSLGEEAIWWTQILHWSVADQPVQCSWCLLPATNWWDLGCFGRFQVFHLLGFEVRLLAGRNGRAGQAIYCIHCMPTWVLWVQLYAVWSEECSLYLPTTHAACLRWSSSQRAHHLNRWHYHLYKNGGGAWGYAGESFPTDPRSWPEVEPKEVAFLSERDQVFRTCRVWGGHCLQSQQDCCCLQMACSCKFQGFAEVPGIYWVLPLVHIGLCQSGSATNWITSTQVVADRGALRIWRWVSLLEGGQEFWLQWQLADTAWLACARVAATRSAAECPSNAPTPNPHSLQRSHPHLNSIFASKSHARDPLHWVICIRLIHWHGTHLQAVVIVIEILLHGPEKLPSSLWSRNLRVLVTLLPKLMSGHVIAYASDLNFYHNIPCFFAGVSNSI